MRLMWRIYFSFFACTMLALAATGWYATHSLRSFYTEQVANDLLTRAQVLASELSSHPVDTEPQQIDLHCKEFGRLTQTRVTVVLPDGTVIGDSEHPPSTMENHGNRPEIAEALSGKTGQSVRFSDTNRRTLMYLAIPLLKEGRVVAVVRASMPLGVIDWTLHSVFRHLALGVLIVGVLFAIAAFYLARRVSMPLDDMRHAAERLARGDLRARVPMPKSPEMHALARILNQMATQLGEKMATITRQNDHQKAVFSSMAEGVLAVDGEGRILDVNWSASRLLEVTADHALGKSIQEAVRNVELQNFITTALSADGPVESEIILYGNEERHLQLHGTALTDQSGNRLGALVVLNDITKVRRLETMRQDFVANVSHELKTPITALQGCVETLSDPASRSPQNDELFLSMMRRQVKRLGAIVEDLLSLSRIEHDAQHKRIPLETGPVCEVIRRAIQFHLKAAEAKGMTVELECGGDVTAPINAPLLEEAVGNLIDNAIKYSGEKTSIAVSGKTSGDSIEISVADTGPGIEKKHLPRIFERFYRVDQARSRALGGTGLGLAIVKHIVLAHGGTVYVDSTPGQGSTFTIRIPRR